MTDLTRHTHWLERLDDPLFTWGNSAADTALTADGLVAVVLEADVQGRCLKVDARWTQLTGVAAEVALGRDWIHWVHADDRPRVEAELRTALRGDQPFQSAYRLRRADGSPVWVWGQAILPAARADAPSGYLVLMTDLTPQRQAVALQKQLAEEAFIAQVGNEIRQSLSLRQVVNTTVEQVRQFLQTDRVLVFRLEAGWSGSVIAEAVDPAWASLLGTSLHDPCFARARVRSYQRGQVRAIADIYRDTLSTCHVQMLAQYQVRGVLIMPLLQGEELWGLLIAHHCRTPREWQTHEIATLERLMPHVSKGIQQAELYQQLQRSNADLERQVHKSAAQLNLAVEFEATLKRITDRVRDSLDEDQILQTAVQELATVTGVSNCNAAIYDLELRTSTVRYEYTTSLAPFQGRVVQMGNFAAGYDQLLEGQYFQFCSLVPNPQRGRVAMLACPILDDQGVLGDLWLISQEYHAFNEQDIRLVQQVANQCAIAIRQARLYQAAQLQVKELEKLNRLKDDFLSTVSHELRTPMANIKLATQMLEVTLRRSNLLTPQTEAVSKYFQILQEECQRETRLINDLLDLSRLEAGEETLLFTSLTLPAWIARLTEPFIERARTQQQSLQIDLAEALPPIVTDASRLERILSELLNNACKYTPAYGQIRLSASVRLNRLYLEVSNSGAEISSSELTRIFDKFYRIPNNDPWKHGGTGLGLALVKRLIASLEGAIYVTSEAGLTCFTIELPLQPGKAAFSPQSAPLAPG